jgi:hypothetical protein
MKNTKNEINKQEKLRRISIRAARIRAIEKIRIENEWANKNKHTV